MPIVSAGDLTLLRGQGHRSDVYASFLVPPILWQARVNDGSIVQGETTIAFDQGTGSFFSLVEALQDLWLGESAGEDDVGGPGNGRLRIRSISSGDGGVTGTVTVGGHALPIQDDNYLTFKHDYPLRPRYSYVDPATEIWYTDDNIVYTDQHEKPPPVVVAGDHRADFLVSGSLVLDVNSSNSYTIAEGAAKTAYALTVASTAGTPTVNFNTGTGLGDITFTQPGYYWAKFSVTDDNGKTQVSYRCYIVHDPEPSGFYPFVDAQTITLTGDWNAGGWVAAIDSKDNHSFDDIPNHTICIVWRHSWYGSTKKAITFLPDSSTTIFAGYVRGETEEQDLEMGFGNVDLVCTTIEGRLARIYSPSASLVAQKTGVNAWGEIPPWHTVGTIVHALLRWRCTIFEVTDVIGLRDNTWKKAGYEPDDNNLLDMVNNFSFSEGIRARLVCDQGGRMHFAHDMQLMVASERAALNTAFDLQKDVNAADYGGSLLIPRAPEPEAPFVTSNGVYWDGNTWDEDDRPKATGDWCVIAPGGRGLHEGPSPNEYPKQTIPSLAYLRELSGRYLGKVNNPIEEIRFDFAGDYLGVLDIAYDDATYDVSLASGDTPRGQVLTNHPLYCRNVAARFNGEEGVWMVEAAFEPYSVGITGIQTECPSFPLLGGIVPTIPLPTELPGALLTGASVHYKSSNGVAWTKRVVQDVKDLVEDPHWRVKTGSASPANAIVFRCGVGYIRRSTDAFLTTDVDVTPASDPPNDSNDSPAPETANVTFIMGEGSYINQDEFVFLATWQNASFEWRSWVLRTANNGTSWTWVSMGETAAPVVECQELSGTPEELDAGVITDIRTPSWSMANAPRQICAIGGDKYVVGYISNSSPYNIYVQVVDVFGTGPPVLGTKKLTDLGGQTTSYGFTMCQVDGNKFAILDNYYANPQIQICVVSGSTITTGIATNWISNREIIELCGDANLGTAQSSSAYMPTLSAPSPTTLHIGRKGILVKWQGHVSGFCTRHTSFDGFHVCKGTVSGTTFTPDTIDCNGEDVNDWDTTLDGAAPRLTDQIAMSSTVSLSAYGYIGADVYGYLVAYDNSTGLGSTAQFASAGNPTNFRLARLSDTKAVLFFAEDAGFDSKLYARVVTLTGTSITLGANQLVYTYNGVATYDVRAMEVSSTQAVATLSDTGGCQIVVEVTANTTTNLITDFDSCSYGWPYVLTHDVHGIDADDFLVLRDAATINGTAYDPSVAIGNYAEVMACLPTYTYSGTALALGLSIGKAAGDKVWITANRSDELFMLEYALPGLTISNAYSLGDATFAQTVARTFLAYPFVPFGYDDAVYAFGRMDDPQSLGLPAHIIRTLNGGGAWTLIENTWDSDHCGSLVIGLDAKTYAIRNRITQSKLYRDNADSILLLRLTFPWPGIVAPHGMYVSKWTMDVFVVAWVADSFMVSQVPPPHWLEKDITYDHETTAPIEAIIQL